MLSSNRWAGSVPTLVSLPAFSGCCIRHGLFTLGFEIARCQIHPGVWYKHVMLSRGAQRICHCWVVSVHSIPLNFFKILLNWSSDCHKFHICSRCLVQNCTALSLSWVRKEHVLNPNIPHIMGIYRYFETDFQVMWKQNFMRKKGSREFSLWSI